MPPPETKVIARGFVYENDSNLIVNNRPAAYNKPSRRQALLEIRRLIVEEGLSHNEIQLRLNLKSTTYFRYLDLLFKSEQEAIQGNNYTYQRLINETLILNQRYLRRARKLTEIGDDKNVDAEQRIEAHLQASLLERAVHDMTYFAPSYLVRQKLIPPPKSGFPENMSLTRINLEYQEKERDEFEMDRFETAGEVRRQNIKQQQQQ